MSARNAQCDGDLSLSDLLAEPIVQAVMARDGVLQEDMESLIGTMRDRMARMPARAYHLDPRIYGVTARGKG